MNLFDLMLCRRSGRKYTSQPLQDDVLRQIMEAGLSAPSSRNLKPAELVCVTDPAMLTALSNAKTAGAAMLRSAAAAIVVIGDQELSDVWVEDCSIITSYMMLRATELGIANCWVQYRKRGIQNGEVFISAEDNVRSLLGIPGKYGVLAALSLGIPSEESKPHSLEELDAAKIHISKF